MPLTFGSLFAGIGGLDLGLERAGMECRWQVEIDDYARRVLAKHWPNVRRHDDVRTWPQADTEAVDLICGGFPCQDISNAGRRAGIDGERSGLWSEFARIIREVRPRIVLVENVDALAVRGLGRVLGDLAALGFDAEWDRIPAAAVGAPHRRWRIFIVAYAAALQREEIERMQPDGTTEFSVADTKGQRRIEWRTEHASQGARGGYADRSPVGSNVPDSIGERLEVGSDIGRDVSAELTAAERSRSADVSDSASRWSGQCWRQQFAAYCESQRNVFWPDVEPPVCGVADGIPHRVDRLRGLGNAVVPQVAEWIGRRIAESECI